MNLIAKWGKFSVPKNITLGLGEEWIDPNEEKTFAALSELMIQSITKRDGTGTVMRDAHPKDHGCMKARFIVEPNLPADMKVGVFKEAREYPSWVRFSTGSADVGHDARKEFMGIGIKLMDVPGEKILDDEKQELTQDFLMISIGAMPIRNAVEFGKLVTAAAAGKPLSYFFNLSDPHLKEFRVAAKIKRNNANPLYLRYNSTVPYAYGAGRAVKYSLIPAFPFEEKLPAKRSKNYLREAAQEHLKNNVATYDFMVQFQTDPVKMPIEDALETWSEALSPLRKVATLVITQQDFNAPERLHLAEHISLNPWHSLPEHRPLGHMNRSRKVVYSAVSKFRHERNGVICKEPTPDENHG